MKHLHELAYQGLTWLNVTRQTDKELGELKRRFNFAQPDLDECLPPFQRPKIVRRDHYYFIVLHFPVFDRESRRLGFTEVDIFLSANYIVTVHEDKLQTVGNFFADCENDETRARYFRGTMAGVLLELLQRLLDAIFPILLHINEDINNVDKKLFAHLPGREIAGEILRLKTNIVTFRRTMQGHHTVLDRLVLYGGRELNLSAYQSYLNSLREFNAEIWNMLESQKESIYALDETNESLLNLRTNEVMRTLTVITVITFPPTLLAGVLTIGASGTPLVDIAGGFWIIASLSVLGAGVTALFFKKKGWL